MILEFKVYGLKKESRMYKQMMESTKKCNEFVVVGEEIIGELDCFKAQQLEDNGMKLIGGLKIDKAAYLIEKKDLINKSDLGWDVSEIDIPKKYLTMTIIENIQRLNKI